MRELFGQLLDARVNARERGDLPHLQVSPMGRLVQQDKTYTQCLIVQGSAHPRVEVTHEKG